MIAKVLSSISLLILCAFWHMTAHGQNQAPLSLQVVQGLDFGKIALTGSNGWIRVNNNNRIRTRNVISLGGAQNGLIQGTGEPRAFITRQTFPETLTLSSGQGAVTVERIRTWGSRRIRRDGTFDIRVGARLRVTSSTPGGIYRSNTPITVIIEYQ